MNFTQEQQASMWSIVQELADDQSGSRFPYVWNDFGEVNECLFCNDVYGFRDGVKHTQDHEPDCLVGKARALVEQMAKVPTV